MEKTLYLVRHGETLFNAQHKIQGWCDSPLTERGVHQAKTAGEYFKWQDTSFDQAFSSTLERTSDTLELITSQAYTRLKGLKEWNFGQLEGESEKLNPSLPYRDFFVEYGGEEEKEFQKRTVDTCKELMRQKGGTILAVTHGAFCGQFRKFWDDYSEPEYRIYGQSIGIGNCCIFKYEYREKRFSLCEIINHEEQLRRMKG
ncbi:histidine phosphatase family protein [Candidatus Enterococcus ferrettii]|uniref:Histidine phosphatase family protein n=1 Tax=Candidatus Enterococcus ferrettii TaxID=2815324 RepID=A0ABV0EWC1_9ENTE|nr:histidine phosphatase family protein [Enterococcus sp. 665A]MBO1340227.1 histidine phosphatase family protein [Enterococcus sp. 665A]